jgi:hypothetical protein
MSTPACPAAAAAVAGSAIWGLLDILNTLGGTSGDPRARFYAPDVL